MTKNAMIKKIHDAIHSNEILNLIVEVDRENDILKNALEVASSKINELEAKISNYKDTIDNLINKGGNVYS